jgi:hypothetical protein
MQCNTAVYAPILLLTSLFPIVPLSQTLLLLLYTHVLTEVELFLTEELPGEKSKPLQWALHTAESFAVTPSERGNLPLAKQHLRPRWLSKSGYIAFGSLRSYPLGQLMRLTQALVDRSWPMDQPEVRVLVLQALYHLGSLYVSSTTGRTEQVWRQGWLEPHGAAAALVSNLDKLADVLDPTPREHDSVLLLGEMAG